MSDTELEKLLEEMERRLRTKIENEASEPNNFGWIAFGMLAYVFFHSCNQ